MAPSAGVVHGSTESHVGPGVMQGWSRPSPVRTVPSRRCLVARAGVTAGGQSCWRWLSDPAQGSPGGEAAAELERGSGGSSGVLVPLACHSTRSTTVTTGGISHLRQQVTRGTSGPRTTSKLVVRVRFPSPAPTRSCWSTHSPFRRVGSEHRGARRRLRTLQCLAV